MLSHSKDGDLEAKTADNRLRRKPQEAPRFGIKKILMLIGRSDKKLRILLHFDVS